MRPAQNKKHTDNNKKTEASKDNFKNTNSFGKCRKHNTITTVNFSEVNRPPAVTDDYFLFSYQDHSAVVKSRADFYN